jgi:hypothetical protein
VRAAEAAVLAAIEPAALNVAPAARPVDFLRKLRRSIRTSRIDDLLATIIPGTLRRTLSLPMK